MDYSIKIGGEAGQGIQTIGDTIAKVFARSGVYVFTHQDYESRIRGGHNFYQVRISDYPVYAPKRSVDLIVALDKQTIPLHINELTHIGQVIYDSMLTGNIDARRDLIEIPFLKIAEENGNKIMANTVATGAILGMLGIDIKTLLEIIEETFTKKGENIVNANKRSAIDGYDYAIKNCPRCSFNVTVVEKRKILISGVEAIATGAISGGCKFYTAYPMTPSTEIMNLMASMSEKFGIIVEQSEDEIAAINMAIGASFAGVRAMTATSGGGFALMVEGLSLAGMTETPVVIGLGQRPGPATGFPTRTEQADLNFALYTAHGEFPRIVFAPGNPEQALYLTNKAFDLAEKYQVPAIILFDQHLADSQWTYDELNIDKLIYRDYRLRKNKLKDIEDYKRHAFTETGISPLAVPGESTHLVVTDSDEHDEEGHIVEDKETRIRMVEKRFLKKLPLIKMEIEPPLLYGDNSPEILLTCWGSNYGVVKEVVDIMKLKKKIAMLHFSEIYPFPSRDKFDYLALLNKTELTIIIENNAGGQFARLMRAETGYLFKQSINKYDGRPFTVEELLEKIEKILIGRTDNANNG